MTATAEPMPPEVASTDVSPFDRAFEKLQQYIDGKRMHTGLQSEVEVHCLRNAIDAADIDDRAKAPLYERLDRMEKDAAIAEVRFRLEWLAEAQTKPELSHAITYARCSIANADALGLTGDINEYIAEVRPDVRGEINRHTEELRQRMRSVDWGDRSGRSGRFVG